MKFRFGLITHRPTFAQQARAMTAQPSELSLWGACLLTLMLVMFLGASTAQAQGRRGNNADKNTKSLDVAAEKAQTEYLTNLADLASKYEDAGDFQKASDMLRSILVLKPDAEVVKTKLKNFEEMVFKDNVQQIDLDPGAGWVPVGVMVTKDKPFRIEAEGTYRLVASDTLGPMGYPGDDLIRGVVTGIPCGALMSVVGKANDANSRRDPKDLPQPVFVGNKQEITPTESGPLLLRVNVPDGSKCTGKLKIRITGNISPLR